MALVQVLVLVRGLVLVLVRVLVLVSSEMLLSRAVSRCTGLRRVFPRSLYVFSRFYYSRVSNIDFM